jgi:broad specificity phosphatase PhoE
MRLFLVRHAESAWGADRRVHGQSDPPLSDLGRRQAAALAEVLEGRHIDAVYSSPLLRAYETASAIAATHQLSPIVDERFRETNLGAWEGQPIVDLEDDRGFIAWKLDPSAVSAPGGETLATVTDRVVAATAALHSRHPTGSVVLVTHSIVGRALISHLLGSTPTLVPRLKLKTASISVVRLDPHGNVLERLGDVCHLRGT